MTTPADEGTDMSWTMLSATDPQMRRLEGDLAVARETLRLLERDKKTLERIRKVEEARLNTFAAARWRHSMQVLRIFEPWPRLGGKVMRKIGVNPPPPSGWDVAGIFLDPVDDVLLEVRNRWAAAHNRVRRLEEVEQTLKSRRDETSYALWRSDEETIRRFEAPGRVRTALARMVDDVFATIRRQEEALDSADYEEVWRLWEVEKAQRAQLHGLWRIDPVSREDGIWTAVTKEKRLPQGMGACFPAGYARNDTRERLAEARVRGCPSEIQRLEEEERMLDEMSDEIGGCVISHRFYPAGLLPAPGTSCPLPRMNGHHLAKQGKTGRKMDTTGATDGRRATDDGVLPGFLAPRAAPRPWWRRLAALAGHP